MCLFDVTVSLSNRYVGTLTEPFHIPNPHEISPRKWQTYSLHQKKTISRHYGCTNTEDFVESYLCLGNSLLLSDYNSFVEITDSLPPSHYEENGIIPSDTLAVPPLPLPNFKEATPDDSTEEENGMIPADAIAVPTLPPLPGYKNAIADESSEAVTCIEVRQKSEEKIIGRNGMQTCCPTRTSNAGI